MARAIELKKETKVVVTPKEEVALRTDKISVDLVTDDGARVIAHISFFHSSGTTKVLTLWEDVRDEDGKLINDSYTKIGQWTDSDVNKRILELL